MCINYTYSDIFNMEAATMAVALKQAQIDLAENSSLVLSNPDRDLMMNALDDPPEPNEALKRLFQ